MVSLPEEPKLAINRATLAAVSDGDPGIEADLAREFARSAPGMIANSRLMLEEGNSAGVQHWAHSLKGSGLVFGAEALVELCQTLENAGSQGTLAGTASLLQALEEEWERVQKQLTQLSEKDKSHEHIDRRR